MKPCVDSDDWLFDISSVSACQIEYIYLYAWGFFIFVHVFISIYVTLILTMLTRFHISASACKKCIKLWHILTVYWVGNNMDGTWFDLIGSFKIRFDIGLYFYQLKLTWWRQQKENLLQRHEGTFGVAKPLVQTVYVCSFLLVLSNIFIIVQYDKGSYVQMPSSSETMNKPTQAKRKYDPDDIKYWYGFNFSEGKLGWCFV